MGEWICTGAIFNQTVFYLGYMLALTHVLNILTVPLASCNYQAVIILFLNGAEKKRKETNKKNIWCYHVNLSLFGPRLFKSSLVTGQMSSKTLFSLCMMVNPIQSNPIIQSTMRFCWQFTGIPPNPKPSTAASSRVEAQTTQ